MTAAAILHHAPDKTCTKCGASRPLSDFNKRKAGKDGLASQCRDCATRYGREFFKDEDRKAARKIKDRLYYEANKDRVTAKCAEYRSKNPEAVSAAKKACYAKKRTYYLAKVKANAATEHGKNLRNKWSSEYARMRRADPVYVLKRRIYCAVNAAFSDGGFKKNSRTHEILGCDWEFFKRHIEMQFVKGMSWDRLGSEIHIDHIVPLVTAKTEADVVALNHYTNLRPLWAADNLTKNAQITHLI